MRGRSLLACATRPGFAGWSLTPSSMWSPEPVGSQKAVGAWGRVRRGYSGVSRGTADYGTETVDVVARSSQPAASQLYVLSPQPVGSPPLVAFPIPIETLQPMGRCSLWRIHNVWVAAPMGVATAQEVAAPMGSPQRIVFWRPVGSPQPLPSPSSVWLPQAMRSQQPIHSPQPTWSPQPMRSAHSMRSLQPIFPPLARGRPRTVAGGIHGGSGGPRRRPPAADAHRLGCWTSPRAALRVDRTGCVHLRGGGAAHSGALVLAGRRGGAGERRCSGLRRVAVGAWSVIAHGLERRMEDEAEAEDDRDE